jgi:penicillin-binding protein-related factor A (putative recombinase)
MLGIGFAILFGCFMIADAIMFVNGYRSYCFWAKTEQEKSVRRAWFKSRGIEWNEKQ